MGVERILLCGVCNRRGRPKRSKRAMRFKERLVGAGISKEADRFHHLCGACRSRLKASRSLPPLRGSRREWETWLGKGAAI